jgi:RNA polymerase sigma-70 factor, ECF subfamily
MTEMDLRAPQPDDSDVLAALAAKDLRRALTVLMDRYGHGVYRFAYEMTRDASIAEDVRQTVFVEAYRDLEKFQGKSAIRSWLFGIARHRCLDHTKSRNRWWRRYKNDTPVEAEVLEPVADHDLDRTMMARVLVLCLERLQPAAREAVVLRYQLEMAYDEIAQVTGDRVGTLQQRVARALPVLRKCVEARTSVPVTSVASREPAHATAREA